MNPQRSIEYLAGSVMGFFIGLGLDLRLYLLQTFDNWLDWSRINITWWMYIPFPVLLGLFMSKAIADLHLEDY